MSHIKSVQVDVILNALVESLMDMIEDSDYLISKLEDENKNNINDSFLRKKKRTNINAKNILNKAKIWIK